MNMIRFTSSLWPVCRPSAECRSPQPQSAQVLCARREREGGSVDGGWGGVPETQVAEDHRVRILSPFLRSRPEGRWHLEDHRESEGPYSVSLCVSFFCTSVTIFVCIFCIVSLLCNLCFSYSHLIHFSVFLFPHPEAHHLSRTCLPVLVMELH